MLERVDRERTGTSNKSGGEHRLRCSKSSHQMANQLRPCALSSGDHAPSCGHQQRRQQQLPAAFSRAGTVQGKRRPWGGPFCPLPTTLAGLWRRLPGRRSVGLRVIRHRTCVLKLTPIATSFTVLVRGRHDHVCHDFARYIYIYVVTTPIVEHMV